MNNIFYIVLPSNSSSYLFPNNKISSFKVQLSNPLQLDPSKWEVALSEIQLVHTWYNVRKEKNTLIKTFSDTSSLLQISEGNYTSIEKLIEEIKAGDNSIQIEYSDINRKIKIDVPKDVELQFNGSDIARCFGFDNNAKLGEGMTISTSTSTINIYHSIYVLSLIHI